MQFGVSLAPKVDDLGFVSHLEDLGFDTAWFSESHLYWSDPVVCAAIAASQTRRIQIGVGILAAGIRLAPVTAAAAATINRIAPGRTALGIGRGTTSWRTMGHPQLPQEEFIEYLHVLRSLLDGDAVDYTYGGRSSQIQLASAALGFVDVDHEIPMAICGLDDTSLWAAGSFGDAIVEGMNVVGDDASQLIEAKRAAATASRPGEARRHGTPLGVGVWTNVVVLEPGERLGSRRVRAEAGPLVLERLHELHAQLGEREAQVSAAEFADSLPPDIATVWEDYCQVVESKPARARPLRRWAGHCVNVPDDEAHLITDAGIRASVMVGTPDELVDRLDTLQDAGVDHLMIQPALDTQYDTTERFSRLVMSRVRH